MIRDGGWTKPGIERQGAQLNDIKIIGTGNAGGEFTGQGVDLLVPGLDQPVGAVVTGVLDAVRG